MVKFESANLIVPQERGQEIEVVDTYFLEFDEDDKIYYDLESMTYMNFRSLAEFIEDFLENKELPPYDSIVVLSLSKRENSKNFEVTFDLIKYKS